MVKTKANSICFRYEIFVVQLTGNPGSPREPGAPTLPLAPCEKQIDEYQLRKKCVKPLFPIYSRTPNKSWA